MSTKRQKHNTSRRSLLDKVFVGCLLAVFGGIVLHAPLTVGFSTFFPEHDLLIKSWKEILLGIALILFVVLLTTKKQWSVLFSKPFYLIAGFAALNVLLIPFFYTGAESTIAGIFINVRYLLFFVLVYGALRLYPQYFRPFLIVFGAGAFLVVAFAVLQTTVLPHDVLKYIGYGEHTIAPFLTVDENINYIRINSTLRGPNPLGAYAVISLVAVLCAWLLAKRKLRQGEYWLLGIIGAGSVVALWASYSRSAALAAIVAVGVVLFIVYGRTVSRWMWLSLLAVALVIGGSLYAFRDTQFVSQVILHEDPLEGNDTNSNDGHAASLIEGLERMARQPLGGGVGSTGSASLLGDSPLIIENQYLFIAHETGWLGLALFLAVSYMILVGLWKRRSHWLAVAVFASGSGLMVIGMVLPVWVDDTVSIIWWGLAAITLAIVPIMTSPKVTVSGKKLKKK